MSHGLKRPTSVEGTRVRQLQGRILDTKVHVTGALRTQIAREAHADLRHFLRRTLPIARSFIAPLLLEITSVKTKTSSCCNCCNTREFSTFAAWSPWQPTRTMAPTVRLFLALCLCIACARTASAAEQGQAGSVPKLPADPAAVCNRATMYEVTSKEFSCSESLYRRDPAGKRGQQSA